MPTIRPNLAIVTLVLEVVWFAIAVAAYESAASDNVHSLAVTVAVIGVIWAAPAIAICLMAWLVEQGLRVRAAPPPRPMASPQPPPPDAPAG